MPRDAFCRALRRRSGRVNSNDPLAAVFYQVLERMTGDELEGVLAEAERGPFRFTNGWQAKHAIDLARRSRRLRKGKGR